MRHTFAKLYIDISDDWCDVSDSVPGNVPSLQKGQQGALQFTTAVNRHGDF